jgi:chemotaxis protein MotB
MKRRREEHDNADRWVVSYADFITLLFAFFTTMYAISHVDLGKLERFAGSMRSAFKANGVEKIITIEGIKPVDYGLFSIEKELKTAMDKFDKIEGITTIMDERGLRLILGESVLFDSGTASLKEKAKEILSTAAPIIKGVKNHITIEGHTDNIPISNARFPSNWELSVARATAVLVYLIQEHKIDPSRLSASGYAEWRPIASNTTPEGRAKNRRVEIIFEAKTDGKDTYNR